MLRTKARLVAALLVAFLYILSCDGRSPAEPGDVCGPYPDWNTSLYVLPYLVGASYYVIQGNCTPSSYDSWNSHQASAPWAYSYDFRMPIGTNLVAARAGTVAQLWEEFANDDKQNGNAVIIQHDDGTYSAYGHLTQHGVLVELGQQVTQGEEIALSGMSGNTDTPHLHFQVGPCQDMESFALSCRSLPVTFRNTRPNPNGLQRGEVYEALAY